MNYREMQWNLPEGGKVAVIWPESMTLESVEMVTELLTLQVNAQRRYEEKLAALHGPRAPQKPVDEVKP